MADVEMTDAGASASAAPKMKSSKAGASADLGDKKRFEVKKVRSDICATRGKRLCILTAWT